MISCMKWRYLLELMQLFLAMLKIMREVSCQFCRVLNCLKSSKARELCMRKLNGRAVAELLTFSLHFGGGFVEYCALLFLSRTMNNLWKGHLDLWFTLVCSHAAMQTDALLRLLHRCCMYWCYCARRIACCVLVPLRTLCCHCAYWLCCARCIAFCALIHRTPVANKPKRALLKKTRNRAKAGM